MPSTPHSAIVSGPLARVFLDGLSRVIPLPGPFVLWQNTATPIVRRKTMRKRMFLVVTALTVLAFSSIACDDGDLVGGMQDAATGGQEALEESDNWTPEPAPAYPSDEALNKLLEEARQVLKDVGRGGELYVEDATQALCITSCGAMYGPTSQAFASPETLDACVENCYTE